MQVSRARLVVCIAADRKALVCTVEILHLQLLGDVSLPEDFRNTNKGSRQIQSHLQSQATAFQNQATQKMEFMTSIAQRDAIVMRIITFIALLYIPATFVSVNSPHLPSKTTLGRFPTNR